MESFVYSMIDALDLEILEIKELQRQERQGSISSLVLSEGEKIESSGEVFLYKFVLLENIDFRDDTPVYLICGQENVAGTVVSLQDGVLIVALEKDLGPRISNAQLKTDASFLLVRLKEQLETLEELEIPFNSDAAKRILGMSSIRVGIQNPDYRALHGSPALNEDQLEAVRRALGSSATYIWGPPGTGKTATIARIVEAYYRQGCSVLVVSNTNIAVDTVMEHIAVRLQNEQEFRRGVVIRYGPIIKEELRNRFGSVISLGEVSKNLSDQLQKEKDRLVQELQLLQQREEYLRSGLYQLEQLGKLRKILAELEERLKFSQNQFTIQSHQGQLHQSRLQALAGEINQAKQRGTIMRLLLGINIQHLQENLVQEEAEARKYQQVLQNLAAEIRQLETEVSRVRNDIARLTLSTRNYTSLPQLQVDLQATQGRLNDVRQQITGIDQQIGSLTKRVLNQCRILGTTVYRTYLNRDLVRQFDVVVIDEASMIMLPLVYWVAGLAKHAVILAGDFRQLPPIVVSKSELAKEWLKKDAFEKAGIPKKLTSGESVPYLAPLSTQYRMCPQICSFISKLFYPEHPLSTPPEFAADNGRFPLGKAPFLYIDTASFHPWAAYRVGTFSRYNLFHALLIRNIISYLWETGFIPPLGEDNNKIGVVVPYAAQAKIVYALLQERLGKRAAGMVGTVHRFQGNEKKVILFDLTDSTGTPLSHFLKAMELQEEGARLLNVALSRAQEHLIILGNFEYLRKNTSKNRLLYRLLSFFQSHGERIDVRNFLPIQTQDWEEAFSSLGIRSVPLPEEGYVIFNETFFYKTFLEDLHSAQSHILIASPFITESGLSRWMDSLRAAKSRGVNVQIITRPPPPRGSFLWEETDVMYSSLRSLGISINFRAKMHEKIAVLDHRILWHGSLNILSHKNTRELMWRSVSARACEEVIRLLNMPRHSGEKQLPDNPSCDLCGKPTIMKQSKYGFYFECEDARCKGKIDAKRAFQKQSTSKKGKASQYTCNQEDILAPEEERLCPNPGCNGRLVKRKGRHGYFWGCSNYPHCRYTENMKAHKNRTQ